MDLEKLTILIVDDMQFSRETIRISMQKSGVQNIIMAENALKALVAVEKHKPDVILVDKMMPKVDGPQLIRKIRAKNKVAGRHSYIILLTADESESALRDAMLSGADHYLYKDAKGDKIINCIEYIDTQFRAKQILQELEEQEQRQREGSHSPKVEQAIASPPVAEAANETTAVEAEPEVETTAYQGPRPSQLSYLIVDDEEFSAESLKRVLHKLKIEDIRIARNALEALKLHEKQRADIMLVDYMMPKVDGIKLTEMVRKKDIAKDRKTPIIMVTAAASLKKIEEAITAGVDEYLYKPPNAHDLVVRMESAFKKHNPDAIISQNSWAKVF
jgi:CheY-like chemotaxis protein